MDGYGVELSELSTTGDEFIGLADEAREAMSEFSGGVAAHEGANEGFTTTSKAGSLATQWEFQIDDICKRTAMAGGLLQDSSTSYQEVEETVIDSLGPLDSGS